MVVDYREYMTRKKDFVRRHDNEFKVETSPMEPDGSYHKEYICADGAIWYEHMQPTYECVEAIIRKCRVEVEVKMLRIEFYSSDDNFSNFYYEQF